MIKIYWYKKQNGEILDIGETHAWQVHNEYISRKMGYKYLGWSDGRFIQEVKLGNRIKKDSKTNIAKQFTKAKQNAIYEAVDKEIENANPEPPIDRSREEMGKKGIGVLQTPGLANKLR